MLYDNIYDWFYTYYEVDGNKKSQYIPRFTDRRFKLAFIFCHHHYQEDIHTYEYHLSDIFHNVQIFDGARYCCVSHYESILFLSLRIAQCNSSNLNNDYSDHIYNIKTKECESHIVSAVIVIPVGSKLYEEYEVDVEAEEIKGSKLKYLHIAILILITVLLLKWATSAPKDVKRIKILIHSIESLRKSNRQR